MARSLIQTSFNQDDLANEWEEAYYSKSKPTTNAVQSTLNNYNAIFSDDDEEEEGTSSSSLGRRWFGDVLTGNSAAAGYIDPVISTSTYHIHQADNALMTLKHVILEDGWKKALKHKSGVMVHMKNGIHKGDKTPIFKGEAVIQGFSPQAIFYVIGMRKLWDEQYEDGNLVDNLNDTTSLTYEVMKPTATSKSRDLALVEKIECTQNGAIVFACTSVETPRIPRVHGRTRINTKLQGWVLEPLHGGPQPATKVVFVVQESMKGWVPAFTKKTLARRPLVIAKVAEYLERKTERMRSQQQQQQQQQQLKSLQSGHSRRPSVMNLSQPQQHQFFNTNHRILQPESKPPSIMVAPPPPPPPKKHISFADRDITYTPKQEESSENTIENTSAIATKKPIKNHLYPSHRHPIQKVESLQLLKKLTFSHDNWQQIKMLDDGSKQYALNTPIYSNDEEDQVDKKTPIPFLRTDGVIEGGWTAEQLCSVIHCYGARKIWDSTFESGRTVERFSQKDYLVHWFLAQNIDIGGITSIETDPITGTVYTATTSITDSQIPPIPHHIRHFTDLYGWVFRPTLDKHGRTLSVATSFVCNAPLLHGNVVTNIRDYLSNHGCPPYIRRVAGKVVQESLQDSIYEVTYVAKHQPSNTYRARKTTTQWCTDVRFHRSMFDKGIVVEVRPLGVARVQVLKEHVKVYTTDESVDGKQMSLILKPYLKEEGDKEGTLVFRYQGDPPQLVSAAAAAPVLPLSSSSSSSSSASSSPEPTSSALEEDEDPVPESKVPRSIQVKENDLSLQKKQTPDVEAVTEKTLQTKNEKEEVALPTPLKVPKGYLLIPEQQNNNIIIITDELSFNGQQLSAIFIAMVVCYYMGKFTSCSSC